MTNSSAIDVVGVAKSLGANQVLKKIDLQVSYGEIVGVIGANGSGKTLLLRLICGLAYPDKGKIITGGRVISPKMGGALADVGLLLERPGFLPHLTGIDNLHLLAILNKRIKPDEVKAMMVKVGLDPDDRRPVRAYSMGMKQRLGIAQAIMERPKILLLDEPTNGLDPEFTEDFLNILGELSAQQVAILITSHEIAELALIANRILLLEKGVLKNTSITDKDVK